MEEGVEHMSNAVTLCGQPQALLQILQSTLPSDAFRLLVAKLPEAQARMRAAASAAAGVVEEEEDVVAAPAPGPVIVEEELE